MLPNSFWMPPMGSSPHVRGARVVLLGEALICGIIPACAGSTISGFLKGLRQKGSSPHVRGARLLHDVDGGDDGIIPACAGSTRISSYM